MILSIVPFLSPTASTYLCDMNYFELFGLPQAPSIDRSLLAKKFFELQKENHPDFFTQGSEVEKEQALERSAAINKAFNIFQDDQKTIEYFLQQVGIVEADEKYDLPPAFLMDMMDINEELSEGNDEGVIQQVHEYEDMIWQEAKPVVDGYRSGSTGEPGLLKLKEYYYKKKYLKRILDRLSD